MWVNQGNMRVHCSNIVINILRITETHMLTCYRQTMEWNVWGDFRCRDAHPLAHDLVYTHSHSVLEHSCTKFSIHVRLLDTKF